MEEQKVQQKYRLPLYITYNSIKKFHVQSLNIYVLTVFTIVQILVTRYVTINSQVNDALKSCMKAYLKRKEPCSSLSILQFTQVGTIFMYKLSENTEWHTFTLFNTDSLNYSLSEAFLGIG